MLGTVVVPNFQEVEAGLFLDMAKITHFTILPNVREKRDDGEVIANSWWCALWSFDHLVCEIRGESREELLTKIGLGKQSGIIQPGTNGMFR